METFTIGRDFNLVTDQRSVSFMLDLKHRSKIKNDENLRWRLELAEFDFTTIYRPGKLNCAPDTFSWATSASVSSPSLKSLKELHETLCHFFQSERRYELNKSNTAIRANQSRF